MCYMKLGVRKFKYMYTCLRQPLPYFLEQCLYDFWKNPEKFDAKYTLEGWGWGIKIWNQILLQTAVGLW